MKLLLKAVLRKILGEYSLYWVYGARRPQAGTPPGGGVRELDARELVQSPDPYLAEQAGYAGEGARAFGLPLDGELQAVCFYWYGERYRPRGFWPLGPTEAKLVQIVTTQAARGRGLATALIAGSTCRMFEGPWSALYARIWHSNGPSLAAFEKAGWRRVAFVAEVNPLRLGKPWRLRWRLRAAD